MTQSSLRVALAQCNPLMGDIEGNTQLVLAEAEKAAKQGAQCLLFPELVLCGYPPEDLLFRPAFARKVAAGIQQIVTASQAWPELCLLVGAPQYVDSQRFNAAYVIVAGELLGVYQKQCLPNYGVFDEQRYFSAGQQSLVFEHAGARFGVLVCEDLWQDGPIQQTVGAGAELLLCLNASPFHESKLAERQAVLRPRLQQAAVPLLYCNSVGGQDELVFDGRSMLFDASQPDFLIAAGCQTGLLLADFERIATGMALRDYSGFRPMAEADISPLAEVYNAIVLAVRDYVNKNGFPGVVLGLSGGIDSSLVVAIAVDALGPERVEVVLMPSRYTSDMSNEDAALQAKTLGIHWHSIPIEPGVKAFEQMLEPRFDGMDIDTTEENIQARLRGMLLMAISNKTGKMVLTTSNKSETAIGYATLYGDMAGGYGPLKDVFKTLVYALAEYRNQVADGVEVIPRRVIERPPSAELRPDQKDSDSLPAYEVLDPILALSIETDESVESIVAQGFDEAVVRRVVGMVQRNEYKRQQASPGVKITRRAFGRDRRYPITSGYRAGI